MELGLVAKTSRNVCIELKDTGIFYTDVNNYDIYINGVYTQSTNRVITSIYGLLPDTDYNIEVVESAQAGDAGTRNEANKGSLSVHTDFEYGYTDCYHGMPGERKSVRAGRNVQDNHTFLKEQSCT